MPEIIEYRPEWACDFARYAKMPRTALGPLALRIDHNRIFMFALTGVRTSDIPCCFAIFSAPRPPWPRLMPKRSDAWPRIWGTLRRIRMSKTLSSISFIWPLATGRNARAGTRHEPASICRHSIQARFQSTSPDPTTMPTTLISGNSSTFTIVIDMTKSRSAALAAFRGFAKRHRLSSSRTVVPMLPVRQGIMAEPNRQASLSMDAHPSAQAGPGSGPFRAPVRCATSNSFAIR